MVYEWISCMVKKNGFYSEAALPKICGTCCLGVSWSFLTIYLYIYIYIHVCVYVYIYI